jgi:hypothetical protein
MAKFAASTILPLFLAARITVVSSIPQAVT